MKKKPNEKLELDFMNPKDCRRFMRGFRLPEGNAVDQVETESGKTIRIKDATDQQIVNIANQIYDRFYTKLEGCHFVEEQLH